MAMTGETDLARLVAGMTPALDPATHVFATVPGTAVPPDAGAILTFAEAEGVTLVLPLDRAAGLGLAAVFPCRRIVLTVHSSLDAVGFMAAVTAALARAEIGVNPVAGFYHDHLFVPEARAEDAMAVLQALARGGPGR
jgi:hypothetical protein